MKNLTALRLTRLAVVPYSLLEWLSKKMRTPNELRIWLETMIRTDVNFIKEDWYLFFAFFNGGNTDGFKRKKSSVLTMGVKPVTINDPFIGKWADQRLRAT